MYGTKQSVVEHELGHSELVAILACQLRPKMYLELGVQFGSTFNKVYPHCKKAIGVDNIKQTDPPPEPHELVIKDTIEYLKGIPDDLKFDMVFVDSQHEFEHIKEETLLLDQHLVPNAIVIFHDTYPANDHQLSPIECGDAWRIVSYLKTLQDWEFVTLPTQHGLTICRKAEHQVLWMKS